MWGGKGEKDKKKCQQRKTKQRKKYLEWVNIKKEKLSKQFKNNKMLKKILKLKCFFFCLSYSKRKLFKYKNFQNSFVQVLLTLKKMEREK